MRGTLVTGGNLLLDCAICRCPHKEQRVRHHRNVCLMHYWESQKHFWTAQLSVLYNTSDSWREKEKKNKRKLIKCLLADPFNTNNVTRSMATVSAGLPGHWQGHRTPCTLTGIYLQRSWVSPNAESSQVPLNYFKVNRSWGNWAPPDKPFRNPWPFLLHVVTLFILHVLQEPTGIVTGSIISSEYSAEHCPVITVSRETWHFH